MPQTARGIVYPDSSGHTRTWEHWQTLGETADAAIDTAVQQTTAGQLVQGGTTSLEASVAAGGTGDITITFPKGYTAAPAVVAATNLYNVTISCVSIATSGATLRVFNNRSGAIARAVAYWIATGAAA